MSLQLKVKEVIKETVDAVTIVFESTVPLTYKSGQYITLDLEINNQKYVRSYSLSSCKLCDNFPAISVKRVNGGVVSTYLTTMLKVGDILTVLEPAGTFIANEVYSQKRQVVLWAAGSGISPIVSIAKAILYTEPSSKVALVYSNHDENSIILKSEIERLVALHNATFQCIHVLSHPSEQWFGLKGRLNKEGVVLMLEQIPVLQFKLAEHFICGPDAYLDLVKNTLKSIGVPDKNVHFERFTVASVSEIKSTEACDSQVTVTIGSKKHSFKTVKGQAILNAAHKSKVSLPHSCQNGFCTACRCKVIKGSIILPDDQEALTAGEIADGYSLTCIGIAGSEVLELEY